MSAATLQRSTAELDAAHVVPNYGRFPLTLARGAGARVWDEDDRGYLDFTSGIAVNSLGHAHPAMQAALAGQAAKLIHTSNLFLTRPQAELAALLGSFIAEPGRIFFSNSGAEANEGAFKFARRWGGTQGFTQKHHILAVRGSFHGRMPGTLAATDRPAYRLPFRPLMGGVTIVERDLDELASAMHPDKTAAVIVEPIQGEGGVRVVDPAFLRGVRALTRERNVLLILDEIQCGLGRTGSFFAYEQIGVVPDMLTIAKPLANGLPIGAILVNDAVARTMKPGDHGTTFGGGPLLAHVAHHVVQRLSDPTLLQHVRETGAWFGEQLQGIADRTGQVRAIRGTGLMWGMDVHEPAAAIIGRAFEKGLLLVSAGEHTLRFLPPLVITKAELAEGLAILESVMGA
jgi:predicted acetylornithine/succinylornithine family transaminase